MLIKRSKKAAQKYYRGVGVLFLVLWSFLAWSQDEVSFLRAESFAAAPTATFSARSAQSFTFQRNLIFFPAKVNGKDGNFILDTGAPTLLLNSRGKTAEHQGGQLGIAAGGAVKVANQQVTSFEMGGVKIGKRWALSLDLRAMEQRTGQQIDGYVGHDLLRGSELRIDFPNRTFQLLHPERKPLANGASPRAVFKFQYVDHLPVITLKVGKHKLRFAIDTGAGVNLLDERFLDLAVATGQQMNIQGLDGGNKDCPVVTLNKLDELAGLGIQEVDFVGMNLDHLQEPGAQPLAGIIGSASLKEFLVGINYRHQRIYFW